VLNPETGNVIHIPGVQAGEQFEKWSQDGRALIVSSSTPWQAHAERVEIENGRRTIRDSLKLSEMAGCQLKSGSDLFRENQGERLQPPRRVLGTLHIVEGLH